MKFNIKNIISPQLFRNSYWSAFDLGIYPLLMIIATPYFIHHLGAAQYGLWMLISNITQLMNAMNMGVGDSTIRQVSKFSARNERKKMFESVNVNFSLSIILFLMAGLTGYVLSLGLLHFNLFHVNESGFDASKLLRMAALSTGLKFVESVLLSAFKGLERFDISARLSLVSRNSVVVISLFVLSGGFGLNEIIEATVVTNLLNILVQVFVLRKVVTGINLFPKFRFRSFSEVFSYNGWYWLQSVIALIGFLSDKFLVAYFTDLKTLGYYSVASLIAIQIHNILLAFGAFIFPRVSFKNELKADTFSVYRISALIIAGLGWVVLLLLLLAGNIIFRSWLGAEVYEHAIRFINLYLVYEACILLIIVPYYFLNGTAHVKLNSLFEILLRTSHVLCMFLFYYQLGSEGLIWGLIIATLFNLPFQYYLFRQKVFNKKSVINALAAVFPAVLFIAFLFVTALIWKLCIALIIILSIKVIYFDSALPYFKELKSVD